MADLYKIKIIDIENDILSTEIFLHNTQVPDLPAKKNIGLQIITDSFYHMCNWVDKMYISMSKIEELKNKAVSDTILSLSKYLYDAENTNYQKFCSLAEEEIIEINIIKEANWNSIDEWLQEIYDDTDFSDTKTIPPSITYAVKVSNVDLLSHLQKDLIWTTSRLWDKEE